ncbi:HD domain-containing phosphohydrolase [Krasilnikovia sp. MM14-A1259]|uniref:HD domain-containing phosphohydrolase n=1 Tax=Krasilnikovia sp. MM14-A1259 TaxID=3373539 RepID=UPI00399CE7E3
MTSAVDRPRILLVDDEPHILDGLRRQLRRNFEVETAVGAANGLFALKPGQPFEVIVSDFLMPGINGAEFLAAAAKAAPTSTRVLLTGHTSLADAAEAVNQGQVYRMLLKPVDSEDMITTLRECVAQHRLVTAEKELLERTLRGSVKALTDVLSLVSPAAFGRATRMRQVAATILDQMEVEDRWAVELAVEMSQLGVVSLPPNVADKLNSGAQLDQAEQGMVDQLPAVAEKLISPIPRMDPVVDAIRSSRKGFDGSGLPRDGVVGARIPFGARLLRLLVDHDALLTRGLSPADAVGELRDNARYYDPAMLAALGGTPEPASAATRDVAIAELKPGMVLAAAVVSGSGDTLVDAGQEITVGLIARLENMATLEDGVREPLTVRDAGDVSAGSASVPTANG